MGKWIIIAVMFCATVWAWDARQNNIIGLVKTDLGEIYKVD